MKKKNATGFAYIIEWINLNEPNKYIYTYIYYCVYRIHWFEASKEQIGCRWYLTSNPMQAKKEEK